MRPVWAAEWGKHPVEIGHDEIEVRFAPISRRLRAIRTFTREPIFRHILEIPRQQSACSAKFSWIRRRRSRDIW